MRLMQGNVVFSAKLEGRPVLVSLAGDRRSEMRVEAFSIDRWQGSIFLFFPGKGRLQVPGFLCARLSFPITVG